MCEELSKRYRIGKVGIAKRIPACLSSLPFEMFTVFIGIFGSIITLADFQDLSEISGAFVPWVPILTVLITIWGIFLVLRNMRRGLMDEVSKGASIISWMTLCVGLLLLIDTRDSGVYVIGGGVAMIIISSLRQCHYRALSFALQAAKARETVEE